MNLTELNYQLISLDSVDSTNTFAMNLLKSASPMNGTVVYARDQQAGKGQRGNQWLSKPGENLTFSMILYPNLEPDQFFLLNMISSLTMQRFLSKYTNVCRIKWPNDVLIGTKKCAGILIENSLRQHKIAQTVIGVGLNVNQESFEERFLATSLKAETGKSWVVEDLLQEILEAFRPWWDLLQLRKYDTIREKYHQALFGLNQALSFSDANGPFEGIIRGVDARGLLQIDCKGERRLYDLKEIQMER